MAQPAQTQSVRDPETDLKTAVAALHKRLDLLENQLTEIIDHTSSMKTVVIREVSRGTAKKEIAALFASGRTLDYEDIVDELRLDLEQVVDLCAELINEGAIGVDADRVHSRRRLAPGA